MADTIVQLIGTCPDGIFVDATVGAGGHLQAVFEAYGNRFRYFGFDLDSDILRRTSTMFSSKPIDVEFVNSNFSRVADLLQRRGITQISAVLFDLGIGSFQIDNPDRGFSYLHDGPLSLSFGGSDANAAELIARTDEREMTRLLREYGEEPKAKSLAKAIANAKEPIESTGQLADLIRRVVGDKAFIKTSSRVFQALRIAVNDEFGSIAEGLNTTLPLIAPGGRALVITYHSLEDHLVKRILKKFSGKCICPPGTPECRCGKAKMFKPLGAKPVLPDSKEVKLNSRARSAKLRVVERLAVAV
jgi:16S rRNA (cytosine1402-N4)-methyltransferase